MSVSTKIFSACCLALPVALAAGFVVSKIGASPGAYLGAAVLGWAVTALAAFVAARTAVAGLTARVSDLLCAAARDEAVQVPANQGRLYEALAVLLEKQRSDSGLLHGVFAGLPMPYLLVDAHEKTLSTNQALLEMVEIEGSVESCLGKTLAELFYNDPGRETSVGKSIRDGVRFSNLEVTITGHKGRHIDVLANIYPIHDTHNHCLGGLCIYVDMTAQRKAESIVREKNERMSSVAQSLAETVQNVATLSGNIRSGFDEAGHCAAESTACVEEAASFMQRMNTMLQDAARNADTASEGSVQTKSKAAAGAEIVESSLKSISAVRDVSMELKKDMSLLDEHARSISRVMNVISDIADQTNLLALNAAIEAARAGEAGRGFAVVADEVRKLAEKTMISTHDVGEAIKAIQESAGKSAASVDTAVTRIEEATEAAGRSGEALRDIVLVVEKTAGEVGAIAAAGAEQAAAGESVNRALLRVSEMAGTASQAVGCVDKEITKLGTMVVGLETSIELLRK